MMIFTGAMSMRDGAIETRRDRDLSKGGNVGMHAARAGRVMGSRLPMLRCREGERGLQRMRQPRSKVAATLICHRGCTGAIWPR